MADAILSDDGKIWLWMLEAKMDDCSATSPKWRLSLWLGMSTRCICYIPLSADMVCVANLKEKHREFCFIECKPSTMSLKFKFNDPLPEESNRQLSSVISGSETTYEKHPHQWWYNTPSSHEDTHQDGGYLGSLWSHLDNCHNVTGWASHDLHAQTIKHNLWILKGLQYHNIATTTHNRELVEWWWSELQDFLKPKHGSSTPTVACHHVAPWGDKLSLTLKLGSTQTHIPGFKWISMKVRVSFDPKVVPPYQKVSTRNLFDFPCSYKLPRVQQCCTVTWGRHRPLQRYHAEVIYMDGKVMYRYVLLNRRIVMI